jgi:hypothetical protein
MKAGCGRSAWKHLFELQSDKWLTLEEMEKKE